jgi:hypothetical protein
LRAVITLLLSSQRPICIFIIGCTLFLLHLNDVMVAASSSLWRLLLVTKIAVGARLVVIANLFGLKRLRRPQINSMALTANNQNVINLRVDYSIPI